MTFKIINKQDIKPIQDPCGELRELYHSDNLSIAHDIAYRDARKHMHKKMEEVYYVEKGEGQIVVGETTYNITAGDTIPIPLNTWHYLKIIQGKQLEVLVITHPKYDPDDVHFEESSSQPSSGSN
ncbi:cupin domain-containing protein [Candidatus Woesearchaeota archaeon]|nr:cupin domain-containing protein [Candidatus Woesearchaeota archaeon]MBT6518231.1 cupin domain-containing protein [Candidatus Woesearchaeota archaeon]MBT7368635.1 cupin domain-containing protein [Candidatus Woesearchaeota archaeon]